MQTVLQHTRLDEWDVINGAAITLQAWVKGVFLRWRLDEWHLCNGAALSLQCRIRGALVRARLRKKKARVRRLHYWSLTAAAPAA